MDSPLRMPTMSLRNFGKFCMDPHTAYPLTVTPLPFHGMSDYPYPDAESYPLDEEHLRYIRKYNTREVGGL